MLPQANCNLSVPPGHSVPPRWRLLQAVEPGLPAPAAAGPGGVAPPSVLGSHPAAPSCLSPVSAPAPAPAEPLWQEGDLGLWWVSEAVVFITLFCSASGSYSFLQAEHHYCPLPVPSVHWHPGLPLRQLSGPPLLSAPAHNTRKSKAQSQGQGCNPPSLGPWLSCHPGHFLASYLPCA